jgi:hypothetical protein
VIDVNPPHNPDMNPVEAAGRKLAPAEFRDELLLLGRSHIKM